MYFHGNIIFSQLKNLRLRLALSRMQNLAVIILLLHLTAEFPTDTTTDVPSVWLTARLIRAWALRVFESFFFQEYIIQILIIFSNKLTILKVKPDR